jgi:hypothetical protein
MSPQNATRLRTLESAPLDKWIALSEDQSRILAVGDTYGELSDKLDAAGEVDAVVMKTSPAWGEFAF